MAAERNIDAVIETLRRHEQKDLLRFVAVGSVDDGKSTLIGRLLHDTHGVYEDQLSAVQRATQKKTGEAAGEDGAVAEIDFSLFTDGLKAEREQGITIDVAYRYFSTEKRKFIIADTPGHVQYTRNMATGASTANVAIILIDARLGVLQQSRRHAYIASLLGIPRLVVGVNKMDLVGFDRAVFDRLRAEFGEFASKLGFAEVAFLPISALRGDNVVNRSAKTPWFEGPTLLEYLETVPLGDELNLRDLRVPVQTVLRPNLDYRGYAAQIASGVVKKGDAILALPSKKTSRVVGIDTYEGPIEEAFAPMSVTLRLADEIDVSRGDMLVHPDNVPRVEQRFDAMVVWLHERPLDRAKSYLLKHTSQTVRAEVESIGFKVDLETLDQTPTEKLGLNDIGQLTVRTHRPLFVDAYRANRATGAFILVDSLTNDTVAAGMIVEARSAARPAGYGDLDHSHVSPAERRERLGHEGAVIAAEASAPRALLFAIERQLFDRGGYATVVHGEHAVAAALALVEAGVIVVVALPAREASAVEERVGPARFVRVPAETREESAGRAVIAALEGKKVFGR